MNVRFDRLAAAGSGCVTGRGPAGMGTGLVSAAEPPDISGRAVTGSRVAGGGRGTGTGSGTTPEATPEPSSGRTTVFGCRRGGGCPVTVIDADGWTRIRNT